MLFRKNDSDDLFFFLNYNDDNNNNGDSNPSRSIRALSIEKRKGTVCFFFFFFITESLWKQPMSGKFYLSSWVYFKRIPLCLSTRTRGREL